MLNKKEFDILTTILYSDSLLSQREISKQTNLSLGSVNKTIKGLEDKGLIFENSVTKLGLDELEPYRVKRAIFLAAGFGSRLVPITLNTPKPLIRVNGKRMIETLLDAVVAVGIEEIVLVRGYLGEQFDQLKYKYPNIKFIENPLFNDANNISSALCVKDYCKNAYILESDLILYNPKLIRKYEYTSNFLGFKVDKTDDWCLVTDNNDIIIEEKVGGVDCHQMVGISYWNEEDGAKLEKDLQEVYNSPGGKERYWEQVPLVYKKENYKVEIRECQKEDIIEIDSFTELKIIDKIYDI